jgi:HAMP domain-containing protein
MKLLVKFSLIIGLVFGLGLGVVAYLGSDMLDRNARDQVRRSAQLMMDGASAIRHYTTGHVKPAIDSKGDRDGAFQAASVPAFAATEVFNKLRESYPDYSYKEATLNPTNLRDRAMDWEADVIRVFRDRPSEDTTPIFGERATPTGTSVYLAKPLRAGKSCLQCHSTPDVAPASMVKLYGTANGFGWKENEVVGAQIVSVPATLAKQMAERTFRLFLVTLIGVGVATWLAVLILLYFAVIRPVKRFAASADRISQGAQEEPEFPVRGRDEIAMLAGAFNRMHRSLDSAMRMLTKG